MVIYKITNTVNNKIYIGKNSTNDMNYMGSGVILEKVKKKYGIDNLVKEIIEICADEEILNEREKYWIKKLNATNKKIGYNIAEGGNGGNTRKGFGESELVEFHKKLSDSVLNSESYKKSVEKKKGVKRPEHSLKMKEKYKEGKLKMGIYSREISEETKRLISIKNKGKKRTQEVKDKIADSKSKKVYQFDKNSNFISEYKSIDEASKYCGINRCCISDACNGRQKSAGGFIWSFTKK